MTTMALERRYSLREIQEAGLGTRVTLMARIKEGTLPAEMVGNTYKVRESDLRLLAQPVNGAPAQVVGDALGQLVTALVEQFPRLTLEQKQELNQLLTA